MDPAQEEGHEEQREHHPVEDRGDDVHRLDQVLGQAGEEREPDGDHPPRHGEAARRGHVVRIVGLPLHQETVEVDRRRRGQRVQLGRLRRQRGGEERGDQEPDQPVGQVAEDEGDEHVVGVRRLRPGRE